MNTTAEPPVDAPAKTNRRTRWIAVGATGGAFLFFSGLVFALSQNQKYQVKLATST